MQLLYILFLIFVLRTAAFTIPSLEARKSKNVQETAHTRKQWYDHNINTDYTNVVPNSGVIREYWLSIDEVTVPPDGVSRPAMALNGTIPGPTIYADWATRLLYMSRTIFLNRKMGQAFTGLEFVKIIPILTTAWYPSPSVSPLLDQR